MRSVGLAFLLIACSGCAAVPAKQPMLRSSELIQLGADYRAAISGDPDLSPIFSNFSINDTGALLGTLETNSQVWAALSKSERERVAQKASVIYGRTFMASPVRDLGLSNVTIRSDKGSILGWIIASTSGSLQYRLYRP